MRSPSNPVMHGLEGRSLQVAEAPVFSPFKDDLGTFSLCGRCHSCFPALDIEFTWGFNKPTKVTVNPTSLPDLPRIDWCYAYDSIRLVRSPIKQVGSFASHQDFLLLSGPSLTYTVCHWKSQYLGSTRKVIPQSAPAGITYITELNTIPNLQWFLFYGNTMGCITAPPPELPADLDTEQIIPIPLEHDSLVSGSGEFLPDELTGDVASPTFGEIKGWCLALVRRRIRGNPAAPIFTPYSLYQLSPPENPASLAVYNCRGANSWEQVFNPLNLPAHTIRTLPVGP